MRKTKTPEHEYARHVFHNPPNLRPRPFHKSHDHVEDSKESKNPVDLLQDGVSPSAQNPKNYPTDQHAGELPQSPKHLLTKFTTWCGRYIKPILDVLIDNSLCELREQA